MGIRDYIFYPRDDGMKKPVQISVVLWDDIRELLRYAAFEKRTT